MLYLILAFACIAVLGAYQAQFLLAKKRRNAQQWDQLLDRVEAVNLEGIQAIAHSFLRPTKDQLHIEPPVMWQMLGGMEGVRVMRTNATAMLELCVYAERWGQEGELVAQLIRTDALNLSKAIRRIEWAVRYGIGIRRSHFALLEAAGYYDLIQRRLLGLYEKTHVGKLPELQARLSTASAS